MSAVLLTIVQYGASAVMGLAAGLFFRGSFSRAMHKKLRKTERDLVECESLILQLENENRSCKKRLKELNGRSLTTRLFMN
jgi:hypothetical protein